MLLAFNQEAYDAYIAELRDGGMLIYDPDRVTLDPDQASHFQTLAFPMGSIAAKELRMPIVKNVVAVGGMATLFGLETDHLKQVIRKLWLRKGEAVVETNYKALDAGIAYVTRAGQRGGALRARAGRRRCRTPSTSLATKPPASARLPVACSSSPATRLLPLPT